MSKLYTERYRLRENGNALSILSPEISQLLFDCCDKYQNNLSGEYPLFCPDGEYIYGLDVEKLYRILCIRIPALSLMKHSNRIEPIIPNVKDDKYDQFAVLDYIEFIAMKMKTIVKDSYHKGLNHNHYLFCNDDVDFKRFKHEINEIFMDTGLKYVLTDERCIERITDADSLIQVAKSKVGGVTECGLKELIEESITLHCKVRSKDHHLATEKIWDALERIKSYYVADGIDKKKSIANLIDKISDGNVPFASLFSEEFKALTNIGNSFRIRHHEIDKIDIKDNRYSDYFFNRCLALIVLTIEMIMCDEPAKTSDNVNAILPKGWH
jgi:hypothetical protein